MAKLDRNAYSALRQSMTQAVKRFSSIRAPASPRDLFRPIRIQGRKITSLFIEHILSDLADMGVVERHGNRFLPGDASFFEAILVNEPALGALAARGLRRYYGQSVDAMSLEPVASIGSGRESTAQAESEDSGESGPDSEAESGPSDQVPNPEPSQEESLDENPPAESSSSSGWQEGLTEEQRRILMAAQESILVLADGEPHARREIFRGAEKEPWQDLFYKRLEREGIIVKTGTRFQTRWTCVPSRMADISTLEDLIPFILSDAELVAYKATLAARSGPEISSVAAYQEASTSADYNVPAPMDELDALRMAVEKQKELIGLILDKMVALGEDNARLKSELDSLRDRVQDLEEHT